MLCLSWSPILAQDCRPVKLATDAVHRAELTRYINYCQQQQVLSKGKGLVQLTCYQDAEGLACWYLSAFADDRYTAAPPAHYALFKQQVILLYQGNQFGTPLPLAGDATARLACLRKVVGSRVRPSAQAPPVPATGKQARGQVPQVSGGAPDHDLLLKFPKDGPVIRLQPV